LKINCLHNYSAACTTTSNPTANTTTSIATDTAKVPNNNSGQMMSLLDYSQLHLCSTSVTSPIGTTKLIDLTMPSIHDQLLFLLLLLS